VIQNQHIMGWGATNPEPSPGVYDWGDLDRRVQLMRATGAAVTITLCCSPDWMWGGTAGTTDWSKLGTAPTSAHYADYAALARAVALRYPDVQQFQVWNEFKGFWNSTLNRQDYEGYTTMYNLIYDAVKDVSSNARVGGPYVVMDSWGCRSCMSNPSAITGAWGTLDQRGLDTITYWLLHKHGADFLVVDAQNGNWDGVQASNLFGTADKFAAIDRWLKTQTTLPIWYGEWYANTFVAGDAGRGALQTTIAINFIRDGVTTALSWGPQANGAANDFGALFTDTRAAGGGQPYPFFYDGKIVKEQFGPGTNLYRVAVSGPVTAIASGTKTLLVNERAVATSVNLNGVMLTLAAYEVRLV